MLITFTPVPNKNFAELKSGLPSTTLMSSPKLTQLLHGTEVQPPPGDVHPGFCPGALNGLHVPVIGTPLSHTWNWSPLSSRSVTVKVPFPASVIEIGSGSC